MSPQKNRPKERLIDFKGYEIPLFLEKYRLKLDLNESSIGPSPKVMETIKNLSEEDIKFYPAYGEVIKALAEYNNLAEEMIMPSSGADEAINYIFDAFLEANDTVVAVNPSFVMPKLYARVAGCTYKEVNYRKKFIFPLEEILAAIDEKTKLVIVTTPNNPTGEAISRPNMLKILERCKNILVLIDETYVNYSSSGSSQASFLDLLNEYPNIFITRSMSKDFGIAGLRFGYIIANKENISYFKKVARPYSINNVSVKSAIAALQDKEHLKYVISQVRESKKLLIEGLKGFAENIYPSDANFLLIDFGKRAEFFYKKLLNAGIKVKSFGNAEMLQNCLRISIPSVEDTKYILESLKNRDLIVFDIDGVLVDTRKSYRIAINNTFMHFTGRKISAEEIQEVKNLGGLNNDWDLTEYLLKLAGYNIPKSEIIGKFQQLYWGKEGDGLILEEELLLKPESLKILAQKYDLAIFTGRPKLEAQFVLKRHGIENYFYPVITMDDLSSESQKPSPEGLLRILDIVKPLSAYYLGDTHDDMIAAKKAGFNSVVKPIGVLPPQDKTPELLKKLYNFGAETVFHTTEEALEMFL